MMYSNKHHQQHEFTRARTPSSFSSSLLDSIYRSIDEPNSRHRENFYTESRNSMVKKQSINGVLLNNLSLEYNERERSSLRKAIMIEKWMEKQSTAAGGRDGGDTTAAAKIFTTSSSSNSSTGGIFSSSDESCHREKSKLFSRQRSKQENPPLKQQPEKKKLEENGGGGGGGFSKTKLKAMKFYTELKKVKQPSSPGGKIASFINSVFSNSASSNSKKVSLCSSSSPVTAKGNINYQNTDYKSKSKSTRSSLTKENPSSNNYTKYVNDMKKRLARSYPSPQVTKSSSLRDIIKNSYQVDHNSRSNYDCDEDDDDVLSCSSSDLFELDHIIGINAKYREELPVFETTSIKSNQAIANRFIP